MDVDADPENIDHKLAINDKLIKEYEKLYERESKDNKNDTQNLDYQPVKLETKSLPDENK